MHHCCSWPMHNPVSSAAEFKCGTLQHLLAQPYPQFSNSLALLSCRRAPLISRRPPRIRAQQHVCPMPHHFASSWLRLVASKLSTTRRRGASRCHFRAARMSAASPLVCLALHHRYSPSHIATSSLPETYRTTLTCLRGDAMTAWTRSS